MKRMLNIHPQRRLPSLSHQSFRSWFARRPAASSGREVVLFADTFTNFFDPEVGIAAVEVLEKAGFRVVVPDADLCCGRPLYDQGLLDVAKGRLRRILDVLTPFTEKGLAVVGLEPSCLLTFRDELPGLLGRDSRSKLLADNSFLLGEFLAREGVKFQCATSDEQTIVQIIVHVHCHQKAIAGLNSDVALLKQISKTKAEVLDSGCCGMAGAFGYDRDHFEISRQVGERVLFPTLRQAAPDAVIVSDGFSCRSQIAQFCPERRALHLAQVLASAIKDQHRI
jgi:Fe-S oxidoreductase